MPHSRSTLTNRPGVFATGDVVDHTYPSPSRQPPAAARAALDAERYLRDTPSLVALPRDNPPIHTRMTSHTRTAVRRRSRPSAPASPGFMT
jgi:hypothetical protein